MGGVVDGQAVNQTVTNAAFLEKNADDTTTNKIGLNRSGSGAAVADTQKAINTLYTATGASESANGTTYGAPASTISNGDSHQAALAELAAKFHPSTGHAHTGAAGDGKPIATATVSTKGITQLASAVTPVGSTAAAGTANGTVANGDHAHEGVHSLNTLKGDVTLSAGTNVTLTPSGSNIQISAASGGSGSVTSVGLSLPGQFTVTGSPVTGSGTLTAAWGAVSTNNVLASPNGSSGAPSFRFLATDDFQPGIVTKAKLASDNLSSSGSGIAANQVAAYNAATIMDNTGTIAGFLGRPVIVSWTPGYPSGSVGSYTVGSAVTGLVVRLLRDSSVILTAQDFFGYSGSGITFIDVPSAGSHSYQVQVVVIGGNGATDTTFSYWQFRIAEMK